MIIPYMVGRARSHVYIPFTLRQKRGTEGNHLKSLICVAYNLGNTEDWC